MLLGLSLSACNQSNPTITGYLIDENNNVVVIYDNGNQETVGNLTDEDIVNHVTSITISRDGYFVINGIKTSTKVNFNSVTISEDGYYVIDGIKTSIKAGFDSITISSDGYYVVNGIKTSIKVQFDSVEISEDGYYVINGIKTDIKATNVYTVKFNTGFSATVADQKVFEGHKVERPQLTRTGYNLDGWFCNGEEWRFNSDVVLNDMTLSAEWTAKQYTVSFINEKGTNPADMTVTYDSNYTLPSVDSVDGYTFGGWYSGNTKYSGGKWTTDSNITLTAKWTANTYTVTLDPGVGSVSKTSQTVTYGQNYTLPVPTNSYGVFVGWLCDGEAVTDSEGKSLSPWSYVENKTFTVDWEIKIYNATDLNKVHTYPDASFKLMNDIDMTGVLWLPVIDVSSAFTGTFDGNGHAIRNLSIDTAYYSSGFAFGLFGFTAGATIKNLWMDNFVFTSANISRTYYVGAIYAWNLSENATLVENCRVTGSFSIASQSSSYPVTAGGVCGDIQTGVFANCINEISISNAKYAGGLAGKATTAIATNCINKANISGTVYAGGLFGHTNYLSATLCINTGTIYGTDSAGGIAGWVEVNATADRCVNNGSVSATADGLFLGTGGIIGACYGTYSGEFPTVTITKSYNTGTISSNRSGGLLGVSYYTNIDECYNSGSISGSNTVSGIAGTSYSDGSITQTLASGSLSGSNIKTTLAFNANGVVSTNSYYTYSTSSSWYRTDGTYTSEYTGSSLYVDSMFWTGYNPLTKQGTWVFSDSGYPTLHGEDAVRNLVDQWN